MTSALANSQPSWSPSDLFLAALIAGVVALIGHLITRSNTTKQVELSRGTSDQTNRIARENARLTARLTADIKLAEMRQQWINSLRSEMTTFQSLCASINIQGSIEYTQIYRAGTTIELHMNPDDQDYLNLKRAMDDFVDLTKMTIEHKKAVNTRYIAVCQQILKREWDRLQEEVRQFAVEADHTVPSPPPQIPWYRRR